MPLIRKSPTPAAGSPSQASTPGVDAGPPDDVASLSRALTAETRSRVRETILTHLVRIGTAEAAQAIAVHVASDDAGLRTAALDALRAMPAATSCLPGLLADPDSDVRLLGCELVREVPGAEPALLLRRMLETETEANVCAAAVEVLAEIGGPDSLAALALCAERFAGEPFLVFSIRIAIDRIGNERAAPPDSRVV